MRAELRRSRGEGDLHAVAASAGMRTRRQDGLRLIRAGITTPEEVLRVTRD